MTLFDNIFLCYPWVPCQSIIIMNHSCDLKLLSATMCARSVSRRARYRTILSQFFSRCGFAHTKKKNVIITTQHVKIMLTVSSHTRITPECHDHKMTRGTLDMCCGDVMCDQPAYARLSSLIVYISFNFYEFNCTPSNKKNTEFDVNPIILRHGYRVLFHFIDMIRSQERFGHSN